MQSVNVGETLMRLFSSGRTRRRTPAVVAAASMLFTGGGLVAVESALAPAANAVTGTGTQDQTLPSGFANVTPTAQKPESKLWYADNKWWSSKAATNGSGFHIWKLSGGSWSDTGIALDSRQNSAADVLWNGFHLFVASHVTAKFSTDKQGCPTACTPARLFRFTLQNHTWVADTGFPVVITKYATTALTIAQDSAGRLFAAYPRGSAPQVVVSKSNADFPTVAFGAEFRPAPAFAGHPASDGYSRTLTSTTSDDTVAIVAAHGYATLVWSNQRTGVAGFYSARHKDGSRYGAGDWTGNVAETGVSLADNHINLKTFPSDPLHRVFAAVKTSRNDLVPATLTDPLLQVLSFLPNASKPSTGTWVAGTLTTVAEAGTRPIITIDPSGNGGAGVAHAYWSAPVVAPVPPSAANVRGAIWTKNVNLTNLSTTAGRGTMVIQQATTGSLDDPTSTKQPVTSATGEVVEAFAYNPKQYWHFGDNGSGVSLPAAPVTTLTATPAAGGAGLTVSFNDTTPGTGVTSNRMWDLGDGTATTLKSFTHTYPNLGAYPVRLIDYNTGGASQATVIVRVLAPPVSAFRAVQATGKALTVNFTDLSTGSPTFRRWYFGDGTTASAPTIAHKYAKAGIYDVRLTVYNAAGGSTSVLKVVVRASTTTVIAQRPGRPVNLKVSRLRNRAVVVSFRPATANGAKIVRYLAVCRSTNGGATRSRSLYRLSLPVTGLTLGKTYRCYAYAVNRVGLGKPSNVSGLFRPLP